MTDSIKTVVSLEPGRNYQDIIKSLTIEGAIVINIADKDKGPYTLLSPDSIEEILLSGTTKLFLEAMPEKEYFLLILEKTEEVSRFAAGLKNKIGNHYLSDVFNDFTDFFIRWENWATLLLPLMVQRQQLQHDIHRLQQIKQQLSDAGFYYEDNVLCLDEIQYVMLPLLESIRKKIRNSKC